MKYGKFNLPINAYAMIWLSALLLTALTGYLIVSDILSPLWLILPLTILCIIVIDSIQNRHSIRKNYPLIGRARYMLESIRPELRQYFFEGELDGKPFSRRQRSIVYQRAKNEKQTISFGMQDDPARPGYQWAAHSVYPKKADIKEFRVLIGNSQCKQPYKASIFNIGAMSYGALSKTAISALNIGAAKGGFAHNTGEGGISDYHLLGADLIWQIGTGYFGCRDHEGFFCDNLFAEKAAIPQVRMIEVKLSQGAKPGHGGLLPAEKNTPEIAAIRNIQPHTTVHSPAAHSAFSNAAELLQFLAKLKHLSDGKPVGFKICIGKKEEFTEIAEQIQRSGIIPDFISVDGAEGGTGAAPLEFIDHMGMSLADALVFVHKTLTEYGLRDQIRLIASGKIITAFDLAKYIALGADTCYSARGMMFALGCIQALQCDSGKCPAGIATQNPRLYNGLDMSDKSERIFSFHRNTLLALADFIGACGFKDISEIQATSFFLRTDKNESVDLASFYKLPKQNQSFKTKNNIMKLVISSKDYNTIKTLIDSNHLNNMLREVRLLSEEIKKMKILSGEQIPDDLVGINSEVSIEDLDSGKKMNLKITLPSLANLKEKKVSVLAPVSIALLGFRKGDSVEWKMPGGLKKLKIVNVRNEV